MSLEDAWNEREKRDKKNRFHRNVCYSNRSSFFLGSFTSFNRNPWKKQKTTTTTKNTKFHLSSWNGFHFNFHIFVDFHQLATTSAQILLFLPHNLKLHPVANTYVVASFFSRIWSDFCWCWVRRRKMKGNQQQQIEYHHFRRKSTTAQVRMPIWFNHISATMSDFLSFYFWLLCGEEKIILNMTFLSIRVFPSTSLIYLT